MLRRIGLMLAILVAVVIYAYGFAVTQVNLEELGSPTRQQSLARILRALVRPDFLTYEQEEFVAESSAYLVCATLGIDTGDYSIPYIKNWLDDFKAFQEMRRDIEKTVKQITKLLPADVTQSIKDSE